MRYSQPKRTATDVLLYGSMFAIVLLFLPFVIALVNTSLQREEPHVFIPAVISLNTLVLLFSTRVLFYVKLFKQQDRYMHYTTALVVLLFNGFLFLLLQLLSIKHILLYAPNSIISSFLAIIVTHSLLLTIALGVLICLLVQSMYFNSGAELYICFLDVKKSARFRYFYNYWNFLSLLWISVYSVLLLLNW